MNLITLTLAVALSSIAFAQNTAQFRGHRIGESLTAFKALEPNMECTSPDTTGICACRPPNQANEDPSYFFVDDKLATISVFFKPEVFDTVLKTAVARYGQPRITKHLYQNAFGARVLGRVAQWRKPNNVVIRIDEFYDMESSHMKVSNPALDELYDERSGMALKVPKF